MTPESATSAIIRLRAPVGLGAWFTPRLAGKMFGLDPDNNPQSPYLARLFGVRDLVLAVGLQNSSGEARRLWLRLGLVCDLADAAAALLAGRDGSVSRGTTVLLTAPAVAGAALGARALQGASA
jgi:hypothetical protein